MSQSIKSDIFLNVNEIKFKYYKKNYYCLRKDSCKYVIEYLIKY